MMGNWGWNNMMNYSYSSQLWGWLPLIAIWSLLWKGLAIWKSARNDQRYWYIALLLINTLGILEILYLFVFAKEKLVLVREAKVVSKRKSTKK